MLGYSLSRRPRPGHAPGALVDPEPHELIGGLTIYRVDYGSDAPAHERDVHNIEAALAQREHPGHRLTWLHFEGDVSAAQLTRIGQAFNLHPLALEDVINHGQRPKLDTYRQSLFITLALPYMQGETLIFQQVSLFIGDDFVLSFHAGDHDLFAAVRERIHEAHGRLVHAETDYLGYCLADVVVDASFEVLAAYNDHLEALEERIFAERGDDMIGTIHDLKRRLIGMRRVLLSQNELFVRWTMLDHGLIHDDNRPYFRDVQDHAKRVVDLAEGYYDTAGSLLETHLSLASVRLNDVMRVLTLIATIFMPLSFLVGVYGMNFDTKSPWNMPELGFYYGYPILVGVMIVLVAVMLIYFRRKGWL